MRDKCPECGGELQATVECSLSAVELDDDDFITAWKPAFKAHDGAPSLRESIDLDSNVHVYCENDHEVARY